MRTECARSVLVWREGQTDVHAIPRQSARSAAGRLVTNQARHAHRCTYVLAVGRTHRTTTKKPHAEQNLRRSRCRRPSRRLNLPLLPRVRTWPGVFPAAFFFFVWIDHLSSVFLASSSDPPPCPFWLPSNFQVRSRSILNRVRGNVVQNDHRSHAGTAQTMLKTRGQRRNSCTCSCMEKGRNKTRDAARYTCASLGSQPPCLAFQTSEA